MANVEITLRDIAEALREELITRVINQGNVAYTPGEGHAGNCDGYYPPSDVDDVRWDMSWDADLGCLRVTLRQVPCRCWQDSTLEGVFGVGELFMMILEER